ncbi:inverse autotransporter beta domain-containing protein [Planctomicrobium sp. SH668]|uniref:beta strand repeat-containing protein n=1 Tax=Planctomicrobium sp. SH668 TaxID=3448126 RepID=UPI003F5C79B8
MIIVKRWSRSLAACLAVSGIWGFEQTLSAQEPAPAESSASGAEQYTLFNNQFSGSASYPENGNNGMFGYSNYADEPPAVGGFGVKGRFAAQAGTTVGQSQPIQSFDLSPYIFVDDLYLFGEGRIMVGNDGKTGGSLGAGARYYMPRLNSIIGGSGWLDIDNTRGKTFHQWGIGGELLSEFLDIRGNMYVPYGETTKILSQRFEQGSQQFSDRPLGDVGPGEAQGTYLSFQRRIFAATALEGFDTLFTIPLPGDFAQSINLEASAGFYGYKAKDGTIDETYGWRARFDIDLFERLSHMFLEVNDDKTFKTTVAFVADINYWGKLEHRPRIGHSQYNRLAEWVRRNRTVVAKETSALSAREFAVNPETGNRYVIYQVDTTNVGGTDGTLADPFQSLQAAINATGASSSDFIHYVRGNSVINEQINLNRDGIRVIGEQANPNVSIPIVGLPGGAFLPTVTATPFNTPLIQGVAGNAVTISANNTTFAGFNVQGTTGGNGLTISPGATNGTIQDVRISDVSGGNGVDLNGALGTFTFSDVSIQNIEGNALNVTGGSANVTFVGGSSLDNTSNTHASHGYAVNVEDTNGGNINLSALNVSDTGGQGIRVSGSAPGASRANVTFGATTLTNTVVPAPVGTEIETGAVYIRNHSGAVTFLDALNINGIDAVLGGDAIVVERLQSAGSVLFQGDVNISGRRGHGVYVVDSADGGTGALATNLVNFRGNVNINGLGAGHAGTESAVLFQSNSGGLAFSNALNINGGLGDGVEITSGLAAPVGTDIAQVTLTNAVINGISNGTSLNIHDVTKAGFRVVTAGVNISNRGSAGSVGTDGAGIRIFDYAGQAAFAGTTVVNNQLGSFANGVDIQDNAATAAIGFVGLNVNNQLGAGSFGVRVNNNLNATSGVSFNTLNVSSTDAVGVSFTDNAFVAVNNGTLDSTGARAIEAFTTALATTAQRHNIALTSISATGSDFGIFVDNSVGAFRVTGLNSVAGSGGTISGMSGAGAFFQDTNLANLAFINMTGNERGVEAQRLFTRSGATTGLVLNGVGISDSNSEGVFAQNVNNVRISNSTLSGNGIGANEEQIDLVATVSDRDTDGNGSLDRLAYNFEISNNNITDGTTAATADMINIRTGPGLVNPVALTLDFLNNGPAGVASSPNTVVSSRTNGGAALNVNWQGATTANITGNQFVLQGGLGQIGVDLAINGTSTINYTGNSMSAAGATATGIRANMSQASTFNVSGNRSLNALNQPIAGSGFAFAGAQSTGLDLTFLSSGNRITINNNLMEFSGLGSRAIVFPRIVGTGGATTVGIGGNTITRTVNIDDAITEHGILFQVVQGSILLSSSAGNNEIYSNGNLLTDFVPFFYNFEMPGGSSGGTVIQVNGFNYP